MGYRNVKAPQWGGLALGLIFVVLGLVQAAFVGWRPTPLVFCIAGLLIVIGQMTWILVTRLRRR